MSLPSQGFRHAATLLLTNRMRALPPMDSPDAAASALSHIAGELVSLANDMNAPPQAADWLVAEFERTVARLPGHWDILPATQILAAIGTAQRAGDARDLFLVYVPEDRLPVAAPFAIELAKRRLTIAFSEYEVASAEELTSALARGLAAHRAGALLATPELARRQWPLDISDSERFRVIRDSHNPATVVRIADWIRTLPHGQVQAHD